MPPCGGLCGATQECIDDMCQDVSAPVGGTFGLRILAVEVPDFDGIYLCFDSCGEFPVPSFAVCRCPPDPYVEVWRVSQEGQQQIGMRIGSTPVALDEREPDFSDTVIPIELADGRCAPVRGAGRRSGIERRHDHVPMFAGPEGARTRTYRVLRKRGRLLAAANDPRRAPACPVSVTRTGGRRELVSGAR